MLLQPHYDRELYDLYLYDQTATRDRVPNPDYDPGCLDIPDQECEPETIITSTEGTPIAFNPKHWTKIYNDDMDLDFTGSMLITRKFNNVNNRTPSGTRSAQTRSKILNTFPNSDINWFNSGWWRAVLISPKHILCCQHMARHGGYSRNQLGREASFMNKSGEIFTTKFKEISAAEWPGPLNPNNPDESFRDYTHDWNPTSANSGSDTSLLELEDEVPADFGIRIYNKVPIVSTLPKNTLVFIKDNQGRVTQWHAKLHTNLLDLTSPDGNGSWKNYRGLRSNTNNPDESFRVGLAQAPFEGSLSTDTWIFDGEEYDLTGHSDFYVWSGDSGTETYYYSPTHGTVLGGFMKGGPHPGMWSWEVGREFIDYVNENHLIPNGYDALSPVDMSDAVVRQKIKISKDNNFFTDGRYSRQKFDVVSKITKPDGSVVRVPSNMVTGVLEGEQPKISNVYPHDGFTYCNAGLYISYKQDSNKGGLGQPGPAAVPSMENSSEFTFGGSSPSLEEQADGNMKFDALFLKAGGHIRVPDKPEFIGKEIKVLSTLSSILGSTSATLSLGTVKPRGYSASAANITFTPDPPLRGQDVTINASMDGDPYWDTSWIMLAMGGGFATAEASNLIGRNYTFPRTVRLPDSGEIVGDPLLISITTKNPYNLTENNQFTAQSQNITED